MNSVGTWPTVSTHTQAQSQANVCVLNFGALAGEGVDPVNALDVVEARVDGTLVCVRLTEHTFGACVQHTHTHK